MGSKILILVIVVSSPIESNCSLIEYINSHFIFSNLAIINNFDYIRVDCFINNSVASNSLDCCFSITTDSDIGSAIGLVTSSTIDFNFLKKRGLL